MQLADDSGQPLVAEYSVVTDGAHLAVILESLSGRGSGKPARNRDYVAALELILERLRERRAVITAALLDSRMTRHFPEEERTLLKGPVRLVHIPDIRALRHELSRMQRTVGQAPDARGGGNSTRRIRLRLTVPGYSPADAERLAADLATASVPANGPEPRGRSLDARWTDLTAQLSHPPAGNDDPSDTTQAGRFGRLKDQERKRTIERYAVRVAMTHYREIEGYDVEDVGAHESYDIRATRGTEELHIEVKGSTGTAETVELTANEVAHARKADTHLVIVDGIHCSADNAASGGRVRRWTAWVPDQGDLRATRYAYQPSTPAHELPLPQHLTAEK